MEQARFGTPKAQRVGSPLINNLWGHRTSPVKRGNEMQLRRAHDQLNGGPCLPYTGLPSHITPPSKLRKLISKNPFEPDLINRLHLPVISPTIFAKVSSPMQESPGFKWNVDELARIKPARIEEFPVHQMQSPDPELEVKAQAAIDCFFKQNHIIPSPWDVRQKENKSSSSTPNRPLDDFNSTKDLSKSKKDVFSQTVLSLPFDLPQNVEEALKPFFTFTQEQNADSNDINLSNNSLRRKLFFNHEECTDNDSFISLSPVKTRNSMTLSCSPPQSGMFVHGTPLKRLQTKQNNKSSAVKSKSVSPPDISPIHTTENNELHEKIARCSRSAIRLDFAMDISIDNVVVDKSENSINDTSFNENNMKCIEDNHKIIVNNDKTNLCDSVNMEESPKNLTKANNFNVFNDQGHNNGIDLKITTEIENSRQESHKQSNTMFGTSDQQSISNSAQDTGYQTYSMNNTMHTVDSYNNISMNYKTHCNERQVTSKVNNTQLSWRENIENVFSSTPSKYNKD
ncbi:LOW QUALITY PROTEIN: protein aurora borealis [Nylanderia fulva]|uniref:LOW QUALITY PROTEIN: protein aurora borealis n=1 Tax=Nylanderia fulva TaxID=613905 RepID=UPI0010FB22FB|nr:LOW QUALITY PROTEIN: protein aurora borealis [Nylanderia fulva]